MWNNPTKNEMMKRKEAGKRRVKCDVVIMRQCRKKEEKPRLISWLKCKSSKYGEEWTGKQAEKGGGRKRGGSDGGKQLVWLRAARMKIHHRWNIEAWDPSLYATTRLCEEMSTCFSSLLKQLVTSCLSVGGTKKMQGVRMGFLFQLENFIINKPTKQWEANWKQTLALGSCRVTQRKWIGIECTFQHLALIWVNAPLDPLHNFNFQRYCQTCQTARFAFLSCWTHIAARINKPLQKRD